MDYYEMRRADQSIIANNTSKGGVFLEIRTISTTSGSYTYTSTKGSLYFLVLSGGKHALSTSVNGLNQGVLSWDAGTTNGGNTIVAVFAKDVIQPDAYGLTVYGDDGAVAITGTNTVPQFLGTVQPSATPWESTPMPNGQYRHTHLVSTGAVGPSDMLVFFLCALPDSGANDLWYSWTAWMYGTGAQVAVYVYANPGASYVVPTLHMYNVNKPPNAPSDLFALQTFKASTERVYVSGDKNMVVKDEFTFSFPEQGAQLSYTANLPVNAGVFLPEYFREGFVAGSYVQSFSGVVKRVGSQLTFNMLKTSESVVVPGEPEPKIVRGNKQGNHCLIIDLLKYGAGSVGGGSGGTTQSAPTFNTHPGGTTVNEGAGYSFSVSVSGVPTPTLKWFKNDVEIAGANSSTYSGTAAASDNGAVFKCYAQNSVSGRFSNPATLTVSTFTAVYITQHPVSTASAKIGSGQTITLYAGAAGTGTISYQWYDAGMSGTTYTPISGATGTSYSPAVTSGNNGRRFFCRASNTNPSTGGVSTADTTMCTVTIQAADVDAYIQQEPASYTVAAGQSRTFSVVAGGTGPFSYQWYSSIYGLISGANSSSVTRTVGSGTEGFQCRVIGATGVAAYSQYGYLTLGTPPTVSGPSSLTVYRNDPAVFTVSATGATSYAWYSETGSNGPVPVGTNSSSYSAPTGSLGFWSIDCLVSNEYGSTWSATASLQVVERPPPEEPITSISGPYDASTPAGSSITLSTSANGTNKLYQWYKNGSPIGGQTTSSTYAPDVSTVGTNYYKVYISNPLGGMMSREATVTVTQANLYPVIISDMPATAQVAVGGSKTLYITVKYSDSVQWFRDSGDGNGYVHLGGTSCPVGDRDATFQSSMAVNTSVPGSFVYKAMMQNYYSGNIVNSYCSVTVGNNN